MVSRNRLSWKGPVVSFLVLRCLQAYVLYINTQHNVTILLLKNHTSGFLLKLILLQVM